MVSKSYIRTSTERQQFIVEMTTKANGYKQIKYVTQLGLTIAIHHPQKRYNYCITIKY